MRRISYGICVFNICLHHPTSIHGSVCSSIMASKENCATGYVGNGHALAGKWPEHKMITLNRFHWFGRMTPSKVPHISLAKRGQWTTASTFLVQSHVNGCSPLPGETPAWLPLWVTWLAFFCGLWKPLQLPPWAAPLCGLAACATHWVPSQPFVCNLTSRHHVAKLMLFSPPFSKSAQVKAFFQINSYSSFAGVELISWFNVTSYSAIMYRHHCISTAVSPKYFGWLSNWPHRAHTTCVIGIMFACHIHIPQDSW